MRKSVAQRRGVGAAGRIIIGRMSLLPRRRVIETLPRRYPIEARSLPDMAAIFEGD
jgi:hypothetical protein